MNDTAIVSPKKILAIERLKKGWNVPDIADALNVTVATVRLWQREAANEQAKKTEQTVLEDSWDEPTEVEFRKAQAEAEAEAIRVKAQAEAESIRAKAQAEAEAELIKEKARAEIEKAKAAQAQAIKEKAQAESEAEIVKANAKAEALKTKAQAQVEAEAIREAKIKARAAEDAIREAKIKAEAEALRLAQEKAEADAIKAKEQVLAERLKAKEQAFTEQIKAREQAKTEAFKAKEQALTEAMKAREQARVEALKARQKAKSEGAKTTKAAPDKKDIKKTAPDENEDDSYLRSFRFSPSMFLLDSRTSEDDQAERDWFLKRVRDWERLLLDPRAEMLTRHVLLKELDLERIRGALATLDPIDKDYAKLHELLEDKEKDYERQWKALDEACPMASVIAQKQKAMVSLAGLVEGMQTYYSNRENLFVDGIFTSKELQVLFRQNVQSEDPQYRFGWAVAKNLAKVGFWYSDWAPEPDRTDSGIGNCHSGKDLYTGGRYFAQLDKHVKGAINDLRKELGQPLVDLENDQDSTEGEYSPLVLVPKGENEEEPEELESGEAGPAEGEADEKAESGTGQGGAESEKNSEWD